MSFVAARMFLGMAAIAGCIAGCVSQETDPTRVTWGDLAEGKRLDVYLQSRQADLTTLETQAQGLTTNLSQRQSSLDAVESALTAAEKDANKSDAELAAIRQELSRANEQTAALRSKAAALQEQISNLRANFMQLQDKRAAQERIAVSEVQLQRLQGEIDVLERGIERTVLARARHALQMSDL